MKKRIVAIILFFTSFIPMSNVFADVLLNYVPPGAVWGPGSDVTHACKKYQGTTEVQYAIKYVAAENWNITSVSYYAFEQGDYGGTFNVYMNVLQGGTNPGAGTLLATSNLVDVNTWGLTPAFHAFTFPSGFQMTQGQTYYFVIRASTSIANTDCGVGKHLRSWSTIEGSDVKTNAYYSLDSGSTWILDYSNNMEAFLKLEGNLKLTLGWPLDTARSGLSVTQAYGANWVGGNCATDSSVTQKHNGTDYSASYGTIVKAAEAGVVKEVTYASPWAYNIVIEHTATTGWKYTTVYWHVDPYVSVNSNVTKGQQIGSVANLGTNTHSHFGVRIGNYLASSSGTGALPVTTCNGHPPFSDGFIDPENTNFVNFN